MPKPGGLRPQAQNEAAVTLQAVQGVALRQQGKFAEAGRIYGEVLHQQPNHFDALHFLGIIAAQTRRTERAVELIRKAIGLNAKVTVAHCNLGNCAGLDSGSQLIKNKMLIAREIDGSGAHGECVKLDAMC